ncbi:MAG TPA: hypothetical protein VMY37_09755 [Thermoguttaceae bacterium]|nr:hypothetical protein [Thermoguttaceae bacterium]
MPIGPYSPCPGGTGNKIKFCCPDLLSDLQKIGRMLEGEQYQACLRHIEQLEKSNPDKACLLSVKTLLLRILGRAEEAQATAATFLVKHPTNPVALAECAMVAAMRRDGHRAMELILGALAESTSELHSRVYEAIDSLSRVLLAQGEILAGRALARLQMSIQPEDRRAMSFLMQVHSAPNIPLVVKDPPGLRDAPDGVPWKAEFDEARSLASHARWTEAPERLAELAERVDGEPVIWSNLATLRGWIADTPGCIQALRKFASLDVPLEDAVEAEALALFLSDDPLGDRQEVWALRYTVRDVERLQAALASSPKASQMQADLASLADEDSPPPKAVFAFFNVAPPEPGTQITAQNVPGIVGQALLYGKQTDREAQLVLVDVSAPDLDELKALLADTAGDAFDGEPEQELTGHVSASREALARNWRLPPDCSQEDFQRLVVEHVDHAILQTWSQSPLGLLDDRSPQETAGEEAYRVRLLAAVLVLEFWLEQIGGRFDFNRLRSHLGLPTLEPIDPGQTPLDDLPLVRLSRVMVDRLSDDALLAGYRRALGYRAQAALRKFAQAVAERSSLGSAKERLLAFEMMASAVDDSDQALHYVDEGRKLAGQAGQSCAQWDLLELPLRMGRGEAQEASRLLGHLQSQHINEPGVARALTELLIEIGVLNPDGTPAEPPEAPGAEPPSLVVPGQSDAKPGELWTPDSQKPTGDKPRIWTPGMD